MDVDGGGWGSIGYSGGGGWQPVKTRGSGHLCKKCDSDGEGCIKHSKFDFSAGRKFFS